VTCGSSVVFSGTPVSSTNKTDRHDTTEILLKVALNTKTPTLDKTYEKKSSHNITLNRMPTIA